MNAKTARNCKKIVGDLQDSKKTPPFLVGALKSNNVLKCFGWIVLFGVCVSIVGAVFLEIFVELFPYFEKKKNSGGFCPAVLKFSVMVCCTASNECFFFCFFLSG